MCVRRPAGPLTHLDVETVMKRLLVLTLPRGNQEFCYP